MSRPQPGPSFESGKYADKENSNPTDDETYRPGDTPLASQPVHGDETPFTTTAVEPAAKAASVTFAADARVAAPEKRPPNPVSQMRVIAISHSMTARAGDAAGPNHAHPARRRLPPARVCVNRMWPRRVGNMSVDDGAIPRWHSYG